MGIFGTILGFLCTILQAIVFLFVLIATPIDMFRYPGVLGIPICVTFWGVRQCSSSSYSSRTWGCRRQNDTMRGGAAFAIISIFVTLVALICFASGKLGLHPSAKLGGKICAIIAVLTILVSWACAASVYNENMCRVSTAFGTLKTGAFKNNGYYYGGGFGLMVTAWCLEIVTVILAFVL